MSIETDIMEVLVARGLAQRQELFEGGFPVSADCPAEPWHVGSDTICGECTVKAVDRKGQVITEPNLIRYIVEVRP